MSNGIKLIMALGILAIAGACAPRQQDDVVFVEPAPVVAEPTFNKF